MCVCVTEVYRVTRALPVLMVLGGTTVPRTHTHTDNIGRCVTIPAPVAPLCPDHCDPRASDPRKRGVQATAYNHGT